MKLLLTTVLSLCVSIGCIGQKIDSLQKSFAEKVCQCIGTVNTYESLKPKIDECYDQTFNNLFENATPQERKFYTTSGNIKLVTKKLEFYLKSNCPEVVRVIKEYIAPKNLNDSYPLNFTNERFKSALANPANWENKTVAFVGKIKEVIKIDNGNIFLKVQFPNGETIWVGDMNDSNTSVIGKTFRFLGYLLKVDRTQSIETEQGILVISFASVTENKEHLNMYPGSEGQIREWANGKVPLSK